jgi:aspartate-semialdehyde dehydrogenase
MHVAVIGATGLVGTQLLSGLIARKFPVTRLTLAASDRSVGQTLHYDGQPHVLQSVAQVLAAQPDIAFFAAGGAVSKVWAPQFVAAGSTVIDKSSVFRGHDEVPLVVPEVNAHTIGQARLLATPNCSTTQLVLVLAPIAKAYGIKRVVVSTYQAVSGTGNAAVAQLSAEQAGGGVGTVYPHPIHQNLLPHCDVFLDNGYTAEEMKLVHETRKILGLPHLALTATAVRVPVQVGHAEAVNLELERPFTVADVRALLAAAPGVVVQDDPQQRVYPMPMLAAGHDEVFVGRIRADESQPNTLNLWIVGDNLRKGAATNAIQIAEYLVRHAVVPV